jgi:hypothetical protein
VSVEAASPIEIDGAAIVEGEPTTWAHIVAIDADALNVLGIPLLRGRPILAADVESDAPVAWVSAEAATRYFGSLDQALGRRLRIRVRGVGREHQIVGITGDARNVEPERGLPPRVWVPLADPRHVAFVVRAIGDPALLSSAMRQAVRDVAPGVPIEGLETYNQAIARRGASDRVIMGMLTSFAAVALVFAATGLYGIVAFSASRRRAEFGTRVALGAQWRDVAGLVIGQAFKLLAVLGYRLRHGGRQRDAIDAVRRDALRPVQSAGRRRTAVAGDALRQPDAGMARRKSRCDGIAANVDSLASLAP